MTNEKEKRIFAKNLQKYMDIADVDRNQLSKDTGIKYPTICEWLNLRKYPRIDKIEMLANYFGVQKSDLIEDHDKETSLETIAAHALRDLTEEEIKAVITLAKHIKSEK